MKRRLFQYVKHPRVFPTPQRTVHTVGLMTVSRSLLRKRASPSDFVNQMGSESFQQQGTGSLDANLFEDPTGGLTSDSAEEMSTAELDTCIREKTAVYDTVVYHILFTPLVDLVFLMLEVEFSLFTAVPATPDHGLASQFTKYFGDTTALLSNHTTMSEAMGKEKWDLFSEKLVQFNSGLEEVMPLASVCDKYSLNRDVYLPFFRQLSLDLLHPAKKKETIVSLPGLILSLANGRGNASLGLPSSQSDRSRVVSELFLAIGEETGNSVLAYLGIQILRANGITPPFVLQKKLANVFSASARIENDWQMRSTGQLTECLHKWMEYYKKVRLDNKKAMERKQVESHHSSKHKKETTVDDVADYFSGKDNDDFLRSEALNENIDESVRKVNEAEPAQFKKRKVKEKPTGKKKKGQKKAAEEDEEEDSYEVSL